MINQVIQGDCLEVMATLPSHSIDLIATDLPYGTTQNKWDCVIPLAEMWNQIKRVLKPNGVFITTASQPFTSKIVSSNLDWFRDALVWDKRSPVGHLNAKKKHLQRHEEVIIFSPVKLGNFNYNPQMAKGVFKKKGGYGELENRGNYGEHGKNKPTSYNDVYYPTSIIIFPRMVRDIEHPTQKPVALFEYLIKTYSNPGDLVLDCTAGSGTTGVAAINTNRNFILIEKEQKYIDIIHKRLASTQPPMQSLFSEEEMTG